MPLDGFRILEWASHTFGGLPPAMIGGLGVAMLLAGAFAAVAGFRMHPTSWSLVAAGTGMLILTYFIVGAAISGVGSNLQGAEQVSGAATRVVPSASAVVVIGLGLFGLRKALQLWSSEESAAKVGGFLSALLSLCLIFVGVQIVRGANAPRAALASVTSSDSSAPEGADEPLRRRSITGSPRR